MSYDAYQCGSCRTVFGSEQVYASHKCPALRNERPPIGIMPRYIWEEKRIDDIREAINRYSEKALPIPSQWIEEYNDLVKRR